MISGKLLMQKLNMQRNYFLPLLIPRAVCILTLEAMCGYTTSSSVAPKASSHRESKPRKMQFSVSWKHTCSCVLLQKGRSYLIAFELSQIQKEYQDLLLNCNKLYSAKHEKIW